jgi:uncharacterized tellurite resistance protein B-like protein
LDATKLEHFRNLISLSAADGKIEEIERITLSKIAYERGIPMDRLNVMFARANEYQYIIPQNQMDREHQLKEMIDLALVDGEFAKAEHDLITHVAEKLGFSRTELYALIEKHKAGE